MNATNNLRYPDTKPGMSVDDFKKWTVAQLKEYLGDRGINRDGLKVANAYGANRIPVYTFISVIRPAGPITESITVFGPRADYKICLFIFSLMFTRKIVDGC